MKGFILFLLCCNIAQAQKLSKIELLDEISANICTEITAKKIKVTNENVLGVLMIKALMQHKDDVVFYFGKDYFTNENTMQAIGEEIGLHLGIKCPEIFLDIIEFEEQNQVSSSFVVSGKISKLNRSHEFFTFSIQEPSGKLFEFILLHNFETSYLLTDDILKNNDNVEVTYYISELYNAKFGRYINYNIVTYIEKI